MHEASEQTGSGVKAAANPGGDRGGDREHRGRVNADRRER
jgi:hypothetical protein